MNLILFILSFIIGFQECKKENCNYFVFIFLNIFNVIFFVLNNEILFVLFPLLLSQCFIDFKKLELSNINSLFIFIFGIYFMRNNFDIKAILFISLFYIILYLLPFTNLGFGDVKLEIALSLFFNIVKVPSFIFYTLLISLIIGIIYKLKTRQSIFPMGPAIIFAFIIFHII